MVTVFWILLAVGVSIVTPICTIMVWCNWRCTPIPPFVGKYWVPILFLGAFVLSLALCTAMDLIL